MPVKREFSAGGVVYKEEKGKVLWLVIQPESNSQHWRSGRWQLPKGLIEKGESSKEAAVRETQEEGGVKVELIDKAGNITIFFYDENKDRVIKNIVFYLMRWAGHSKKGPDFETARVEWLPYNKARKKLTFDNEKEILDKARALLKKGIQESLV